MNMLLLALFCIGVVLAVGFGLLLWGLYLLSKEDETERERQP
jgi:hypothetical protein